LIASGIALRLAQINWFRSRPGDKVNSPPAAPNRRLGARLSGRLRVFDRPTVPY
jgi:hypothetical protein